MVGSLIGFERPRAATLSWSSYISGFQIEKGIGLRFLLPRHAWGVLFFSKLEGLARLSLSFMGVSVSTHKVVVNCILMRKQRAGHAEFLGYLNNTEE